VRKCDGRVELKLELLVERRQASPAEGFRDSNDGDHHTHHSGDHAQQTPGDTHADQHVRGAIVYREWARDEKEERHTRCEGF
jgi:hypothetical protein